MTKLLVVVSVLMLLLMAASVYADEPSQNLVEALIHRESNGNDNAIGDTGKVHPAYGCLQIRQPCVDDYNRWNKTAYVAKDCLGNRTLSIKICSAYIDHYARAKRLGRVPTLEDMARIWNGGPDGWKRNSTRMYWIGVKDYLANKKD